MTQSAPKCAAWLLALAACSPGAVHNLDSSDGGGGSGGDGGTTAVSDEAFPPNLLGPYSGPAVTYYDNTFVNQLQLQARVKAVFNDTWVRAGVDQWKKNLGLFGGADFVDRFTEPRGAQADFLLGLDRLAPDVCGQAVTAKTGPFAGIDPAAAISGATAMTAIDTIYQRMLYRPASAAEKTDALTLLTDLVAQPQTTASAWTGLCEALVRHPDFIFTLPPSWSTATGNDKKRLMLVKVAMDLVARPPTQAEIDAYLAGKPLGDMVDDYLAGTEFRDYYYHRMRVRTESVGTPDTDEPARLWAFLAATGAPFQELLTADYTVDTTWAKATRPAYHGKTGILTMKGFITSKMGLPHFNYSARVMGDFLGQTFEVPPSIIEMRVNATASSTVMPGSVCFGCHQTLTPLAYQRARWYDDGSYHETDDTGAPIDDSDRGLVTDYKFKGTGMEAFAMQAVRKEAFIRRMLNAQYGLLFGRDMRWADDERTVYKRLWDLTASGSGDLKKILKDIILSPTYQGN